MSDNAVIYVSWGDEFVAMAEKSLVSLKEHTPSIRTYLFTDKQRNISLFDHIETIPIYADRSDTKTNGILHSCNIVSEDTVVYLDSDTLILGDISDVFKLSEWFHIALAHAPFRTTNNDIQGTKLSPALPVLNSGVIMYRNIHTIQKLFEVWVEQVFVDPSDQFVLSNLLYTGYDHGDLLRVSGDLLRVSVLPPEYNARTGGSFTVQGEVKILHGRSNLYNVADVVNECPSIVRTWIPKQGMVYK